MATSLFTETNYSEQGVTITSPPVALIGHSLKAKISLGSEDFVVEQATMLLKHNYDLGADNLEGVNATTDLGAKIDDTQTITITLPATLVAGHYVFRIRVNDGTNNFLVEKHIQVKDITKLPKDNDRELLTAVQGALRKRIANKVDAGSTEEFVSGGLQLKFMGTQELIDYEQQLLLRITAKGPPLKHVRTNLGNIQGL